MDWGGKERERKEVRRERYLSGEVLEDGGEVDGAPPPTRSAYLPVLR